MPPVPITDPADVVRVQTIVAPNLAAAVPEVSFGFWIQADAARSLASIWSDIAGPMALWWGVAATNGVRFMLGQGATITRAELSRPLVDPQPLPFQQAVGPLGAPGGGANAPDLAAVISLRTDTSGPAYRGRMYIGTLNTAAINSSGQIDAARIAELLSKTTDLIADLADAGGANAPMCTVSRYQSVGGVVVPRVPPLYTLVVNATIDNHADVQRRRGAG